MLRQRARETKTKEALKKASEAAAKNSEADPETATQEEEEDGTAVVDPDAPEVTPFELEPTASVTTWVKKQFFDTILIPKFF